jgi:hypothetical protein
MDNFLSGLYILLKKLSLCTYPISKWYILQFFIFFSTYMLFITLCCTTFLCKVFHFAYLISWQSHYSRME